MKLLFSLVLLACVARADFKVQQWRFRRAIEVKHEAKLSGFDLDSSIYRNSLCHLCDLRIVRDDSEVPYQIPSPMETAPEASVPVAILNKSVVPGSGLQAVLRVIGRTEHNRLRLITNEKNFWESVRVETSEDGRNWALVRADAMIFDIARQDRRESDLTVEYPVSTRPYLRLTILGWRDPAMLIGASLLEIAIPKDIRRDQTKLTPVATEDQESHATSYSVDIGFSGLAYDELVLSAGQNSFFRSARVLTSDDCRSWYFAGAGTISRTAEHDSLTIQFPEQWSRYLKLVIANGDNQPLAINEITLRGIARVLRFPSSARGRYWLYSRNQHAHPPDYDLGMTLSGHPDISGATLGLPQPNPAFRETEPAVPWTDRNRTLLDILLICTALLIGYVSVKLLLKVRSVEQ